MIQQNAADYQFPGGNLFVFFYNPFKADVMVRFCETLRRTRDAEKRDIIIAYIQPTHSEIIDGLDGFRRILSEWVPVAADEMAFSRYERYRVAVWRDAEFI